MVLNSAAQQKLLAAFLILLSYIALLFVVGSQLRTSMMDDLEQSATQQLDLYVSFIEGELEKFQFLPELLSTNILIKEFLRRPQEKARTDSVNRYLETINNIAKTADTYLMDQQGKTLAASNWRSEKSFIGNFFDYRPYFQEAMRGGSGRYFALGTTSGKRGYYFSYPVRDQREIIGAVVVKIDIAGIESAWNQGDDAMMITDPDGVIFIASDQGWLYRRTRELSTSQREEIAVSNRYPNSSLFQWPGALLTPQTDGEQAREVLLRNTDDSSGRYLLQDRFMTQAGWRVHILSSLAHLQRQILLSLILTSVIFVALLLLGLFLQQRRRRLLDRARYEEQAQQSLVQAHNQLEQRVQERTADLKNEIEVRRKAEHELRQAQSELIQTAKLAVLGQMSTGISHELNQPLAAIRFYADNARTLLDKERGAEARENLERIGMLVDRMAQISAQLKQFSRKSSGQQIQVSLAEAMEASLRIIGHKLTKANISVEDQLAGTNFRVIADPVPLEQILVNLFSNAANACEQAENPRVIVSAAMNNGLVRVSVRDNGPGIGSKKIEDIFEPFFTTRESGLGLGLSISRRIARSMNGELSVRNHPQGGAEFFLDLRNCPDKK